MAQPPQKHIIDSGSTSISSTTQTLMEIAKAVINPDPFTNSTNVKSGSVIGNLTVQIDVVLAKAQFASAPVYFDWYVGYNINGAQTMPTADNVMGSAGADLLNQVFHQDGTMLEVPTADPTSQNKTQSWRLVISVPKNWRKMLRGDTLNLYFKCSSALTVWFKARVIYKEYFP